MSSHTLCPLCATANETLDHLSLRCTFSIDVWRESCQRLGFALQLPVLQSSIPEWWPAAMATLSKAESKIANSFIMLTLRSLWVERNARVFDGARSSVGRVKTEVGSWEM
jgi:hypothetical protein